MPAPPPSLVRPLPWLMVGGLALVAGLLGLAKGWAFLDAPVTMRPDLTLKLAALAGMPLPLLLLGALTTPRWAATRRMLGERSGPMLDQTLQAARRWELAALALPLGLALSAFRDAQWGNSDAFRAGMLVATTQLLAAATAKHLLLASLRAVAQGLRPAWGMLTGGGVFGPAQTAPLLYAPAVALIAALVPTGLAVAVWSVKSAWFSVEVGLGLLVVLPTVARMAAERERKRVRSHLHAAWLAVEEAHALPFATAELLPEPPAWLQVRPADPVSVHLARCWWRRWPGSAWATAGLVLLSVGVPAGDVSGLAAGLLAATVALYGAVRAVSVEREPGLQAARWMGATDGALRRGLVRLSLGLSLPSVVLAVLGIVLERPLEVLGGSAAGVAVGVALVAGLPAGRAREGTPVLALVLWAGALALAVSGG